MRNWTRRLNWCVLMKSVLPAERRAQRQRRQLPQVTRDGVPDIEVGSAGHGGEEDAAMAGVERATVAAFGAAHGNRPRKAGAETMRHHCLHTAAARRRLTGSSGATRTRYSSTRWSVSALSMLLYWPGTGLRRAAGLRICEREKVGADGEFLGLFYGRPEVVVCSMCLFSVKIRR
jgi:hypothetical protein